MPYFIVDLLRVTISSVAKFLFWFLSKTTGTWLERFIFNLPMPLMAGLMVYGCWENLFLYFSCTNAVFGCVDMNHTRPPGWSVVVQVIGTAFFAPILLWAYRVFAFPISVKRRWH